jgi:DHA2 family multidrug resistance protein-like MFS transporter
MSSVPASTVIGLQGRQRHLAVFTILVGIALSVLDTTTIAMGLPTMTRELGVSADQAVWIINAFQLAVLVALLPVAHWGGRVSFRRVYLGGVALWGVASAVACLADSLPVLVAARVAQGLGAAGLMGVNMALVRLVWPPALLGKGAALNSVVVSIATVSGPLLAAMVLSVASWRWLFALNIPACALLLLLGWRALPANQPAAGAEPLAWRDVLLNGAMFVLVFLAAESFGRAMKSPLGMTQGLLEGALLLAAGVAAGFIHVRRQWRQAQALLPLDLLRIPLFRLSMMTSVGSFAAQTMAYVVLPFLLLEAWRATPSQTGLLMSCWPAGTFVAAHLAGRWIGRYHNGLLGALGLVCMSLGLAFLAYVALAWEPTHVVVLGLLLCGVGFGLFQSPNNHTIITCAPVHRAGAAGGMLATARLVGQSLGATVVAVVFAAHGQTSVHALGVALLVAALLSALGAYASYERTRYRLPAA